MLYNKIEDYFDRHIIFTRFGTLEELKKIIDNNLQCTQGCDGLYVKDLAYKDYYDNDFQDYEVMVVVGNDENDLYDLTLYYCVTRTDEYIVVESNFEEI